MVAWGLMGLAIGVVVAFGIFIQMVPMRPLETAPQVDAIVVLTGGAQRIEHGLERFVTQPSAKFFITGVNNNVTDASVFNTFKHVSAGAFEHLKEKVGLGRQATDTMGNAEEVTAWVMAQNPMPKSILLVTANYHMPRSLLLFKRALPDDIQIIEDPVIPAPFDQSGWWKEEKAQKLIHSEFVKFVYTLLHLKHVADGVQSDIR